MIFDKNQSEFPSNHHREIWWWGVGIVPPDASLTNEVKDKCSDNVLEGCYQWYDYFNELCEDMYNHTDIYAPVPARRYRDILENISSGGEIQGDALVWNQDDWRRYRDKFNKSKSTADLEITIDYCLNNLKRLGIEYAFDDNAIKFYNSKYPKIFHAMNTFESSPNIRKTPARHHFAHCEFRQLFKSYSPNYDELLRRVSDESLHIAKVIHDFAKSLKIQRYIHFDIIKYKYKNVRIMDFTITGNEYPTLRVNFGSELKINPQKKDIDTLLHIISERKNSIDNI